MIDPQIAAVRPHVISALTGESLLLEDEIRSLLERGAWATIALVGPLGSGKTTALRHLAAVLPSDSNVALLDEPDLRGYVQAAEARKLVLCAGRAVPEWPCGIVYRLAPWNGDDIIEYLLTRHPTRAASVMARVKTGKWDRLGGNAELWQFALDDLAGDDAIVSLRDTLQRFVAAGVKRAVLHPAVKLFLAADVLTATLRDGDARSSLDMPLDRAVMEMTAELLEGDGRALERLRQLFAEDEACQPMAASLLLAVDSSWRPDTVTTPRLCGAHLAGAAWPGIRLLGAACAAVDLRRADLRNADLTAAHFEFADLDQADLCESILSDGTLTHCHLRGARLHRVIATGADFSSALCERADFEDAHLVRADFGDANLTAASLCGADLTEAVLTKATITEACFAGATLVQANLAGLRLRDADCAGADFTRANLSGCNLEGMQLAGANFESANLSGALLTASGLQVANLANADLREAGLADIDWEGVDLRGANLSGASFHAGSSRSGLVNSPIACEGSKTGFYTDEYEEQIYKAPEEIRKANLCHADLRGAVLDNVDFYLVDLRGARFDAAVEVHLRRCGAILEARV